MYFKPERCNVAITYQLKYCLDSQVCPFVVIVQHLVCYHCAGLLVNPPVFYHSVQAKKLCVNIDWKRIMEVVRVLAGNLRQKWNRIRGLENVLWAITSCTRDIRWIVLATSRTTWDTPSLVWPVPIAKILDLVLAIGRWGLCLILTIWLECFCDVNIFFIYRIVIGAIYVFWQCLGCLGLITLIFFRLICVSLLLLIWRAKNKIKYDLVVSVLEEPGTVNIKVQLVIVRNVRAIPWLARRIFRGPILYKSERHQRHVRLPWREFFCLIDLVKLVEPAERSFQTQKDIINFLRFP